MAFYRICGAPAPESERSGEVGDCLGDLRGSMEIIIGGWPAGGQERKQAASGAFPCLPMSDSGWNKTWRRCLLFKLNTPDVVKLGERPVVIYLSDEGRRVPREGGLAVADTAGLT